MRVLRIILMFSRPLNPVQLGATVGLAGGALLTYVLFTNVQWYHDILVFSWTNPWMWAAGVPVGIALAVITDK